GEHGRLTEARARRRAERDLHDLALARSLDAREHEGVGAVLVAELAAGRERAGIRGRDRDRDGPGPAAGRAQVCDTGLDELAVRGVQLEVGGRSERETCDAEHGEADRERLAAGVLLLRGHGWTPVVRGVGRTTWRAPVAMKEALARDAPHSL